jgi:HEAT repeat protein
VFFYQVIGGLPEAYPLVTPMLRSSTSHEVRHGAILLGRLGIPGAVDELGRLIDHPDEVVRGAVLQALGELHDGPVGEPLRRGLRHRSPRTRAAAADAVVVWRGGVLAVLIAAALEAEHDHETWQAMVSALGRIGSAEACAALATIALTRRGLLRRQGYTTGQRLAAVAALGYADTGHGHATLERLARENEGVVSYAADRVLRAEGLRAG